MLRWQRCTHRLRRLPVTDDAGRVIGLLSVNDLVLESGAEKSIGSAALVETLQGASARIISRSRLDLNMSDQPTTVKPNRGLTRRSCVEWIRDR